MKIHEYQAKELFQQYGLPTLKGEVASTPTQAKEIAAAWGQEGPWMVKAQVHSGGRGKGGGIRMTRSLEALEGEAKAILHHPLVTPQTGPEGKPVNLVLVEEGCDIASELYVAAVLDRASASVAVMASREGGMEIEEVAARTPEKIFKVHVDPALGILPYQSRTLAFDLGLSKSLHKEFAKLVTGLVKLFLDKDCSLAEINPLVITKDQKLIVLDAKINFDDNGLYRHPELATYADPSQEDPRDREAAKWDLSYIRLDGDIGCMVNGAGLAMATMDLIKLAGGEPANFLDVGGGASSEMVREAFKILVSDPKVKAILVNIFGGIMKCDVLAEGIVEAASQINLKVPLVVRLEGTNVEKGKEILADSGLNLRSVDEMDEAARAAVSLAKR